MKLQKQQFHGKFKNFLSINLYDGQFKKQLNCPNESGLWWFTNALHDLIVFNLIEFESSESFLYVLRDNLKEGMK